MPFVIIDDMFINFIRYGEAIPLDTKSGDLFKLNFGKNLASRVIGCVDDDGLRVGVEGFGQLARIIRPIRRPQRDVTGSGT